MSESLVGAIISFVTGLGLWAVLPRGVVLTRAARTQGAAGEPLLDTWAVKNESPLPIRVTSVGVGNAGVSRKRFPPGLRWVELPIDANGDEGVALHFDDGQTDTWRVEQRRPWRRMRILPGEILEARVLNNRSLRIRYRRAGIFGVFERREVVVHGGA